MLVAAVKLHPRPPVRHHLRHHAAAALAVHHALPHVEAVEPRRLLLEDLVLQLPLRRSDDVVVLRKLAAAAVHQRVRPQPQLKPPEEFVKVDEAAAVGIERLHRHLELLLRQLVPQVRTQPRQLRRVDAAAAVGVEPVEHRLSQVV